MSSPTAGTGRQLDVWLLAGFMGALIVFSLYIFTQRQWWLPEVASIHGATMDSEFLVTLAITGAMFVLIHLALIVLLIRFNRSGSQRSVVQPSRRFEFRFAVIAAALIFGVDVTLFLTGNTPFLELYGRAPEDSMIVDVVGEQFAWNFRYPGPDGVFGRTDPGLIDQDTNPMGLDPDDPAGADDILTINDMHVPVNQPVQVRIRAKDVLHSFFLPHFRLKQDAVPGMTVETWFVPTRTGQFEIVCNQLCGLGHYRMRAFLTVDTEDEFDAWLAQQTQTGGAD
jgi:cytochrome c oxidase subunit 2